MFRFIWDIHGYFFWLLMISACCFLLERVAPWRTRQKVLRRGIWQDVFYLVFNGHFAGMLVALFSGWLIGRVVVLFGYPGAWPLDTWNLLANQPPWLQFLFFLMLKDFLEWMIHIMLPRVPWLWTFHKVHHSIRELDWIGNFRFHIAEIVVYKSLTYFPLVVLGVKGNIILAVAVFATLVGHLNHANLKMDYGPLRYIFNSPRLHVWHHDRVMHGNGGQNFAIVFSIWDWLFGTIYYPDKEEQPEELGFDGIESFPESLVGRLLHPLRFGSGKSNRTAGAEPAYVSNNDPGVRSESSTPATLRRRVR